MTRINAGIPPRLLSDKHLLAEHREIKRIPNHLKKHGYLGQPNNPNLKFTLGKGHMLFFMDKGEYTHDRYCDIWRECGERGFNVTDYSLAWDIYEGCPSLWNKWEPTAEAIQLIADRLRERDPLFYNEVWTLKLQNKI